MGTELEEMNIMESKKEKARKAIISFAEILTSPSRKINDKLYEILSEEE